MKHLAPLFAVAATLLAQQPPPTEQSPLGRVSGIVIDVTTQEPVAKASVILQSEDSNDDFAHGRTDSQGKFTIESVKRGRYRLHARRNQYVASDGGAAGSLRRSGVLDVGPGQEIDDVVLALQPAAVIVGQVLDEDGEPFQGLSVQAVKFLYVEGAPQLAGVGSAQTNDKGEYRIYGLTPGNYYVRVRADEPNGTHGGGTLQADSDLSYVDTYYPNADDVSRAILLRPAAAVEMSGIDFRMRRTRTLRVSGHVVQGETGRPGLGGSIALLDRGKSGQQWSEYRMIAQPQDGRFQSGPLRPGSYRLEAVIYLADRTQRYALHDFDLSDKSIEDLDIRTLPGFSLSGRVVLEGAADRGESRIPMQIALEPSGAHSLRNPLADVGDDDRFLFKSVMADSYRVSAHVPGDLYLKAARYGGRDAVAEGVRMEAEGGELEIVLSANGARLDGQIAPDGEGIPGAYVVLVPDDRKRKDLFQAVVTDQYGVYQIKGIAPGRYKLFAWERVEYSVWLDPNVLAEVEVQGVRVEVEEGDVKHVAPELIEAKD